MAGGANPDQVLIVFEVHDRTDTPEHGPVTRPFLPDGLDLIDELLHEHKAIRLIIFGAARCTPSSVCAGAPALAKSSLAFTVSRSTQNY